MKEFIDKLIEKLQKEKAKGIYDIDNVINVKDAYGKAIKIVNELAEEYKNDKVYQLAMMYAKNIYVYGVDVTKEWISAVQNHMALEKAYVRGRQDEADRFAEEYKDKSNIIYDLKAFLKEKFKYNSEQAEIWRDGSDNDAYFRQQKDLYMDRANIYGEVMREIDRLSREYEKDCCEWKWGLDYAQVQCMGDKILFGTRRIFTYCPYCGKKIKDAHYTEGE